ncbi:MAG: hypothetical protein H0W72_13515, partial [Planctomycetes bacterium]|nr:hypothetical protein [Planctomycetota bacterium]
MNYARLSPTLLACVLGVAPLVDLCAAATSTEQRDEHAYAIKALIERDCKLPADRQLAEWDKAGYSDGSGTSSVREALQFAYDSVWNPAKADAKRYDDKKLPEVIKRITGGGGGLNQIIKLVNDTRRIMDGDLPKPAVTPSEEKLAALKRAVESLTALMPKEFKVAIDEVKKTKEAEDKLWDLDEKKDRKRIDEITHQAIEMRLDALRLFYYAHLALREAITRGHEYGLDAKPVKEMLASFLKEHREMLQDWEFQWSDSHLLIAMYLAPAYGEGVRLGVEGYTTDETEGTFRKVTDYDASESDARTRVWIETQQLQAWTGLLRWRYELGVGNGAGDAAVKGDPKEIERGINNFLDFKNVAKGHALDHSDPSYGRSIGQLWIVAGRLYKAKGDSATAGSVWSALRAAKNPLSFAASQWITEGSASGGSGGNGWVSEIIPTDPSGALGVGTLLLAEAQNANPKQARGYTLQAAIQMRAGVAGLNNTAWAGQFVDHGPKLYRFYAKSLSKLQLPYHAAIAANEGLRQVRGRIDKTNPWLNKDKKWTTSGEQVTKLVDDALYYTSSLSARTKGAAGAKKLYEETIELAQAINPDAVGVNQEKAVIVGQINDGDFAGAIEAARAFSKKYPNEILWSYKTIQRARETWFDKVEQSDKKKAEELAGDIEKSATDMAKYIESKLASETDPKKKAELKDTLIACASAKLRQQLKQQKYGDVITQIVAIFAKPPQETELGVAMLKNLARAVNDWHKQVSGIDDKSRKPQAIPADKVTASWQQYRPAMEVFRKYRGRYVGEDSSALANASRMLAQTAQIISMQAEANQAGAKEEMTRIGDEAKRYMADFLEPDLNEKSQSQLVLTVANTLWDINERARAVRLFELFKKTLDVDADVGSYRSDPAGTIDQYAAVLAARPEFKKAWLELRDLLVDDKDFMQQYLELESDRLKEKKRDYFKALEKSREFAKLLADQKKIIDADSHKKMGEALDKLTNLARNLAYGITIDTNLALHYRDQNQPDKALPLFEQLYREYDPKNPVFAGGYVEGVLTALKSGSVDNAAIKGARDIAVRNRAETERDPRQRDNFWIANLQVMQLSAALGGKETEVIGKTLKYCVINKSTPKDDLIAPSQPGDAPAVRRPRNDLAIDLARRYLAL